MIYAQNQNALANRGQTWHFPSHLRRSTTPTPAFPIPWKSTDLTVKIRTVRERIPRLSAGGARGRARPLRARNVVYRRARPGDGHEPPLSSGTRRRSIMSAADCESRRTTGGGFATGQRRPTVWVRRSLRRRLRRRR